MHFLTDMHADKLQLHLTNYKLKLQPEPTASETESGSASASSTTSTATVGITDPGPGCSTSGTTDSCTYGFSPSLIKAGGQRELSKPIIPLQSRVYNQQIGMISF